MKMARKYGNFIPEELMVEILSRLPVKSLMRFKCVCKSWYGIIASHDFVSQHLKNYYYNNDCNSSCLLITHDELPRRQHLNFVPKFADEMLLNLPNQPFHVPGIQLRRTFGPCNGVFCVRFTGLAEDVSGDNYALWNPAIKEFRVLPTHPPITTPEELPPTVFDGYYTHGFGLDPITNDYKLVLIKAFNEFDDEMDYCYIGPYCPSRALVYSLAADSWKDLGDLDMQFSFQFRDGTCYTCLNGICYWKPTFSEPHNVILSFDMAREVFQDIKGPDCLDLLQRADVHLALYNDSIALFVYKHTIKCLDIWVTDGDDWINKISVGPLLGVWGAIGYWRDQVIFQSKSNSLLLDDPYTGEIKDLGFQYNELSLRYILVYKDSLVSIANGNRHVRYLVN